jgi:acetyl-CoA carboxylase biotin carboxylase subunit
MKHLIRKIHKLLVANRGEIALRIMKTASEMGIRAVAVFSEADLRMPFVRKADESYLLGPPQASESYLCKEKIIDIAKKAGANAIHPGYGFLAEDYEFAEMVRSQGIIFVGPTPEAMRIMGDKTAARRLAKKLGVPMMAGVIETIDNPEDAAAVAKKIGYPAIFKAAGGGGGKGMRIVRSDTDIESAYRLARSEAGSAFGDDRVYIEKYLEGARHIEVQMLADSYGNSIHLGERECSVQRRHQKLVEESPSVVVDEDLRKRLTDSALKLVRESKYENAGTIEFLVEKDGNHYFLEMNTRLQVEHPVTEMRTGLDLVREQILIAEGHPLRFKQDEIEFRGAAIECRINAEDSHNGFFPSTGEIKHLHCDLGVHSREDRGFEVGNEVTPYYDSLISKLVAWGNTRMEALERMSRMLKNYECYGVHTNLDLLGWIVDHPNFRKGNFSTGFIAEHFSEKVLEKPTEEQLLTGSILAAMVHEKGSFAPPLVGRNGQRSAKWLSRRMENC